MAPHGTHESKSTLTSLLQGGGNRTDYALGTAQTGWTGLDVVRWRASERLGTPFELEITVQRKRSLGPVALAELIDQAATLRIATETSWRPVHGIIVRAEELERTSTLYLYRLRIASHVLRMSQRVRFRTFVDRTLREVLTALLENHSTAAPGGSGGLAESERLSAPSERPSYASYQSPSAVYRFAVAEPERLDDAKLRSYVVQYGESDLALFHRLLEEEGLTYFFEHGDDAVCLTVTDNPGHVSPFGRELRAPLKIERSGLGVRDRECIVSFQPSYALLLGATTATDFDPNRPQRPLQAFALDDFGGASPDPARFSHALYPSRDADVESPCIVPATLAVERRAVERSMCRARSTLRSVEPALTITMTDEHGLHDDTRLVVVAVTTFATQLEPEGVALDDDGWDRSSRGRPAPSYENEIDAVPEQVRFRPPLRALPPRIHGVHTAMVSADEVVGARPEIHRHEDGRVRLRFPWDERVEPGRPSSCWVRVSQGWAGASYGHVFTPRVGQEVLVAYMAGDPEQPLIIGRVNNAIQPIAYTKPTISSIKTKSSPDSDGFNELRFDDESGKEEVYLQAERNLNELVKASHSTTVGGDQSNGVGGNQTNRVGGDQSDFVTGNQSNTVEGWRCHAVGGHEENLIGEGRETRVVGPDDLTVEGSQSVRVTSNSSRSVAANERHDTGGRHERFVAGEDSVTVTSNRIVTTTGAHSMRSAVAHSLVAPSFMADGGGATTSLTAGNASLSSGAGASVTCVGNVVVITADSIVLKTGGGATFVMTGDIDATAGTIRLKG